MGSDQCYDTDEKFPNSKTFTKLKKWPTNSSKVNSQCDWIQKCGVKPNVNASWIGIDNMCI